MAKVLIIGAGGVAGVTAHKCAFLAESFTEIVLASRTLSKCQAIAADIKKRCGRDIDVRQVDADRVEETVALIREVKPDLLVNLALPYQDLALMEACLATGVDYLDTANYEPPDVAKFEYKWQWAYRERFEKAGLMALLGSGFDPGVTNVFCAWAQKHHFDEIHSSTSSTATPATTGSILPPTSTRRSTSARSPSAGVTGSTASGWKPIPSPGR
jgi:saccharopine dehydrogenase (NAD+, L-lysine forming)